MPESEASAWGRIGSHISWSRTEDRTARTAPARAALEQKFLDEAGGDPVRAAHLRKAYYQRLALKSVAARKAKKESGPAPRLSTKRRGGSRLLDPTGEEAVRRVMRGGDA